jgi:hypothetical protein
LINLFICSQFAVELVIYHAYDQLAGADTSRTQRIPYPVRIGYGYAWDTRWIRIWPHYLKSDTYTCRYEYPYVYSGLDTAHLDFFGPVSPRTGLNPKPHPDEHSTRLPCTGQEHGSSAAALPPLDRTGTTPLPPPLHQSHSSSALEVSDSFPVFHPLIPLFLTSSDMNMAATGDDLLFLFDLHRRTTICFVFLFSRRWQQ